MASADDVLIDVVTVMKKELLLSSRPQGMPSLGDFKIVEKEFSYTYPLQDQNSVVVKVLMISMDPYLREIMNEGHAFATLPPLQIDKPIKAMSISKVLASRVPQYKEGDYIMGFIPVTNYAIIYLHPKVHLKKIVHRNEIPLGHHLGVLGINTIGNLQPGEEVYVSSACDAVGLVVGQLAKLKGCRVVGSAGSDEQINKLEELYNFDNAFNYKAEKDLVAALKRYFPNGLDVYFDSVGGQMLEAVLGNLRHKGRIVSCGMTSEYSKINFERDDVHNSNNVVGKSVRMEGFMDLEETETVEDFSKEVSQFLLDGKIKYKTDVIGRGIEEFPIALARMLEGEITGNAVLFLSSG